MRKVIDGINLWGDDPDDIKPDGALDQLRECAKSAIVVAGMADRHRGYTVPIGGVVAWENHVSPGAVGYDACCGNKAVQTNLKASDVKPDIDKIMDTIWEKLSFGVGLKNNVKVDHKLFDSPVWQFKAVSELKELARRQLGTIGSGNHYVDLFEDENGMVWIGVHFGSRGFGYKMASYFIKEAGGKEGDKQPCLISTGTDLGSDYLACLALAGEYAYAGRDWVCADVARILGAEIVDSVHNHHNFAWPEAHGGLKLWVHRKGATPAFPGQRSFIGGSMGDNAVIAVGVAHEDNKYTLCSTVHGAGRVMSRNEAAGKLNRKTNKRVTEGKITRRMMVDWLQNKGVVLRGAGTDEAPQAYKRLDEVLKAQGDSIRVEHTLRPIGVAMAGEETFDPYKD